MTCAGIRCTCGREMSWYYQILLNCLVSICVCTGYVKLRQLLTKSALNEIVPEHFSFNDSQEKRFKCDACPKSYKYKEGLYTHKRFACGKDPQFQCPYCTYRAYHKGNLKLHVAKNHPDHFEMTEAKFEENGSYPFISDSSLLRQ